MTPFYEILAFILSLNVSRYVFPAKNENPDFSNSFFCQFEVVNTGRNSQTNPFLNTCIETPQSNYSSFGCGYRIDDFSIGF